MEIRQNKTAQGKLLRQKLSRKEQATFNLYPSRMSILQMINATNYDRLPDLIPIRHQRMSASPFAFFRGTASIMAADLFQSPNTGLNVQSIGDCHLLNFGGFTTPERTLVFDANDFDETHPTPWEWDLKRLATSFILAANNNNLTKGTAEDIVFSLTESYQSNMQEFAEMNMLDLWYMKFDMASMRDSAKSATVRSRLDDAILKAERQTTQKVFYKITQQVLGSFEIADQPPLVYHPFDVNEEKNILATFWKGYLDSLQPDRRFLVSQYKIVDMALKVVGVGSVGTRCYVLLLMNEKNESLFIQVKEARASVLEPYTAKSIYGHHGQRVVEGQRLIQAASDIFLGWSTGPMGRYFYFRQLKDKKISPEIEYFDTELLKAYAKLCGRMLARAHAKTGNAEIISAYIGKNDQLNEAIISFAKAYAKQTCIDYEEFMENIKSGKLPTKEE